MKTLLLSSFFLLSPLAMAGNLTCNNIDSYYEEDSLEFVGHGQETTAYYFDNDSYYSIPCKTTALDGYICEDGSFLVRMSEEGYATVSNGVDPEVEFQCF